jgi:hypothetical protein
MKIKYIGASKNTDSSEIFHIFYNFTPSLKSLGLYIIRGDIS